MLEPYGRAYLLDLACEHAALDAQHAGDVDVLLAHLIHPLGETVHRGLAQHQQELNDVVHALDDVVCGKGVMVGLYVCTHALHGF